MTNIAHDDVACLKLKVLKSLYWRYMSYLEHYVELCTHTNEQSYISSSSKQPPFTKSVYSLIQHHEVNSEMLFISIERVPLCWTLASLSENLFQKSQLNIILHHKMFFFFFQFFMFRINGLIESYSTSSIFSHKIITFSFKCLLHRRA